MHQDSVILLHGIFRTQRCMAPVERALAGQFVCHNVRYYSTRKDLAGQVEWLRPRLEKIIASTEGKLHFVGYSMGCLLIRAYLHRYRPERLGRVVMLAPPNQGSEIADRLQSWGLYRLLYGPAGQQLITDQSALRELWPEMVNYEVGVLAGTQSFNPLSEQFFKGEANDGTVSVASTHLRGMTAHKTVVAGHTLFPSSREVQEETLCFLQHGRFRD